MAKNKGNFWVKFIAMLVGLPLTLLALMTLSSSFTSNLWIQLGVAFAAAVVLPLLVADRLLPADVEKGRGIPSTVLTLSWVAIPVLVLGLGLGFVSPMLHAEAAILDESPAAMAAPFARWIALDEAGGQVHSGDQADVGVVGDEVAASVADEAAPQNVASSSSAPLPGTTSPSSPSPEHQAAPSPTVAPQAELAGSEGSDGAMTPSDVFRRWADSVVSVKLFHGDSELGNGTGFVVDRDRVVTNHHVVEMVIGEANGGIRVGVQTRDGSWARDVQLIDFDASRDIALLQVDLPGNIPPVRLAPDESIEVGEPAISIGSPYGLDHTVTDGIVSARRMYDGGRWLQVSSPISPGNSGGPIFDASGAVVGVSTRVVTVDGRAQNLNLAIPSGDVSAFIERTPALDHPVHIGGGEAQGSGSW